jgi:hypothetical protein
VADKEKTKGSSLFAGAFGVKPKDNSGIVSDAAKLATANKEVKPVRKETGFGLSFLPELYVVVNETGSPATAIAWTTFDASHTIPATATGVILVYRARNIESPTGEKGIYVRMERTSVEMQIASVRGTTTSDITSNAGQAFCPLTSSKTFDYKADAMSDQYIAVVGYW